ncbi:iron-containing alcohol dehydrogenase [Roridomyces roridus]|uniref:Iron-containing alcohol dehydrogenase n=1 Tax=Roridomyces roridus TaxID=1738132 RepID=A0AAD7BKW7_9AGAR|nr:iron-containing alcohol dehydrogenase [Roridomyces roridus]
MQPFVYNALPARVIFGHGTISQVSTEIHNLGCSKALILTSPGQIKAGQTLQASLGPELAVGLFSKAILHTPVDVTEEAVQLAQTLAADCVVALGGGSTIGLGKAIALRTDLPQIVIPTTYAGSEATAVLGQTQDGIKTTQKSMKVLPEVIIYDVDLTLGLSLRTTITSGINAIAHAVEALYAAEANPITDLLAEQGIERLARALPILSKDPQNKDARSDALYGAWACSVCAGTVGFALHHKLCHAIGGTFNLSHADTHTVLLPHTVAYNAPFTNPAMVKVVRNLGIPEGVSAARGIYDLAKNNGAPYALKDIGMKEEDLERAVDVALKNPYPNPAPLEREKMLALLRDAYEGRRPA